jgi:phosphoribosylformimino-5-aminoimidazole carboxamide ribotide isomerase
MEIIPAIDIIDGKCVRLSGGSFDSKKVYNDHPLEVAKQFENAGLKRLHLVDLDGARSGAVQNWKVLESITTHTGLQVDFGGGIKTEKDLGIIFQSGAHWAAVGSIAVSDEATFTHWLSVFSPGRFLLGADVKHEKIMINGWQTSSGFCVYDFIEKYLNQGVNTIFCTDVSKDGMLEGPSLGLYKNILTKFPELQLVASGGVSNINDLHLLQQAGCKGAIVGKAIYEGKISLKELSVF